MSGAFSSNTFDIQMAERSNFGLDIEQIEDYDNIHDFLNFIHDNKFSIYTPDKNYFTIFHILIQASRVSDLNKIINYIKEKQNAYKNENEFRFLKQKIKSIMENDEDELDFEEITTVYSNLEEVVVLDGLYDEIKDEEIIRDIKFISNHLRQIITDILKSL